MQREWPAPGSIATCSWLRSAAGIGWMSSAEPEQVIHLVLCCLASGSAVRREDRLAASSASQRSAQGTGRRCRQGMRANPWLEINTENWIDEASEPRYESGLSALQEAVIKYPAPSSRFT